MCARRIVLDTNVLFAGLYSSKGASFKILSSIEQKKTVIALSPTLLFEYEDVLRRKQSLLGLSIKEIDDILNALCFYGEHHKTHFLWRPILSDPNDDHVLELAIAAGVKMIITHNCKDFDAAKRFGVEARTPKLFLKEII